MRETERMRYTDRANLKNIVGSQLKVNKILRDTIQLVLESAGHATSHDNGFSSDVTSIIGTQE